MGHNIIAELYEVREIAKARSRGIGEPSIALPIERVLVSADNPHQLHIRFDHLIDLIKNVMDELGRDGDNHWSDCAVNNGPALPVGECDCGGRMPRADDDQDTSHNGRQQEE